MAFTIELFKFNKKTNSTATPKTGSGVSYNCTPRHSISVMAPVVSVRSDNLIDYTYAYIPRYKRYYWITNITNTANDLWQLSLSVDVLASFKGDILGSSEYVARSSVSYNGNIVDNMYPSKSGSYIKMTSAGVPWVDNLFSGCYVVGVINGQTSATGSITYYVMTDTQYALLLSNLQNQTTMASILGITVNDSGIVEGLTGCLQDISYDVYIAQLNPIQYIVSSVYLPILLSSIKTAGTKEVVLGKWGMKFNAAYLNEIRMEIDLGSISIPKHPQYSSRGQYLNAPPYSTYSTHFPGFGTIELDGARISRWSTLSAKAIIDVYNGTGYLYLNTNDPDEKAGCVGILSGSIGIPVPVTQLLATDLKTQAIAAVAQMTSNLTASGNVGNGILKLGAQINLAISSAQDKILDFLLPDSPEKSAFMDFWTVGEQGMSDYAQSLNTPSITSGLTSIPTLSLSGSIGGSAALWGEWWLKNEYFILVDEDLETLGRPLMEIRKLGDLSGFCQCLNTHIQTSGTATETQAVNSAVMNGFFIE